jgi:hypothetical protein
VVGLVIWNIYLQLKIKGMRPQTMDQLATERKSSLSLDPLTELWSAIVEFRDQSLIYICPIDEKDPRKIEGELGNRKNKLSSTIVKLRQTVEQNKDSYSDEVITKTREILAFAETILIPREKGNKYQNLCQSYQNIHHLTLEINRLVHEKMGGGQNHNN